MPKPKKKTSTSPSRLRLVRPQCQDEDEFSHKEDAFPLATEHLRSGYAYSATATQSPDTVFEYWEGIELLRKAAPEILKDDIDMELAFRLVSLEEHSLISAAKTMKGFTGRKFTIKKVSDLNARGRERVILYYQKGVTTIRARERQEAQQKKYGGPIH